MKNIFKFIWIWFFLIILLLPLADAVECGWGTIETKFKLDDGEWQDTGVTDVPICTYEPFQVRADVEIKKECEVSLSICGVGSRDAYEVIEGPSEYDDWTEDINCNESWNGTFIWTLRPTDEWSGGSAPVLLYVQFTKFNPEADLSKRVKYHIENIKIVHCQISKKIWENYKENSNQEGEFDNSFESNNINSTPDFELILILFSIMTLLLMKKIKKDNF